MSRSVNDLELPGCHTDPPTGNYFRNPNCRIFDVSHTNTSNNHEVSCSGNSTRNVFHRPSVLRSGNILDCIANNQNGSNLSHVFQDDVLGFKVQNLEPKRIFSFPPTNNSVSVRMLKGGDTAVYGQWVKNRSMLSYFYAFENSKKIDFLHDKRPLITFPSHVTISDFCELKIRNPFSLLMVGTDFNAGAALAYQKLRSADGSASEVFQTVALDSAVWCCCTNSFNQDFAIGVENGIYIKKYPSHDFYIKKIQGQVYSVNFNKKGSVIYGGLNTGDVIITDTRVAKEYDRIKIHNLALNETAILEDERYVMCGGRGNFLCKVDLRMVRIAVKYFGDARSTRKIAFSINETFNLLCSTGIDNVTRLWSLSSGKLLRSIPPPVSGSDCRSWLTDDSSKCSLYIAQDRKLYFYEF